MPMPMPMKRAWVLLCVTTLLVSLSLCGARKSMHSSKWKPVNMIQHTNKLNLLRLVSNVAPYVGSPLTLTPFDSMPPISLPENSPPYCIYPPPSPSTATPVGGDTPYIPPFLPLPSPSPGPPPPSFPSPTGFIPTPSYSFPSPPFYIPGPPGPTLSPPPAPPVFEPPVVYPPPTGPPPPKRGSGISLWCVAKPSVPDPIIQEAMNYACGSGADCGSILPSGSCFQPDTLFAHASYAFNSYWQRTKVAGGTCEFGGTAMLVTVDPSYDGCHFLYY